MKKIIIAFTLLIIQNFAIACDVCGGATTFNSIGLLPQYKLHLIGMRYQSTWLQSKSSIQDHNQSLEIIYRNQPFKRLLFSAHLPLSFKSRIQNNQRLQTQGISDMRFNGQYMVINTLDSSQYKFKNSLLLGLGAQLPTGKFMLRAEDKTLLPLGLQNGTGAWAFPLSAVHTMVKGKWGIHSEINYVYTTTNERDYHIGATAVANFSVLHIINKSKNTWAFMLGSEYKTKNTDMEYGKAVNNTQGNCFYARTCLVYITQRGNISLQAKTPVVAPSSNSIPTEKQSISASINFYLP